MTKTPRLKDSKFKSFFRLFNVLLTFLTDKQLNSIREACLLETMHRINTNFLNSKQCIKVVSK